MYEANQSFSGIIAMAVGEVREITDEALAKDLLKAKLIKKHVVSNAKQLQYELAEANKTIEELQSTITEKEEIIEQLQAQINSSESDLVQSNDEGSHQNNDDEPEGSEENQSE